MGGDSLTRRGLSFMCNYPIFINEKHEYQNGCEIIILMGYIRGGVERAKDVKRRLHRH
jgi:hypothetical protein